MKYKVGDVVIVNLKLARERVYYDGPAIVTISVIKENGGLLFEETNQICNIKHLVGHATSLMLELV